MPSTIHSNCGLYVTDNIANTQGKVTLYSSELRGFKCQPEANFCDKRGIIFKAYCLFRVLGIVSCPTGRPTRGRGRKMAPRASCYSHLMPRGRVACSFSNFTTCLFRFNAAHQNFATAIISVRQYVRTFVCSSVCLPDSWISIRNEGGGMKGRSRHPFSKA